MKLTTIDLLAESKILEQSKKFQTVLECKFVLLSNETEHILIFGPLQQYNYHANLVEKFCLERNISSSWHKKPDIFEIFDKSLKIKGGGWFQIDFSNNTLFAKGLSTAYGRFDELIFEEFRKNKLILNDFLITIIK